MFSGYDNVMVEEKIKDKIEQGNSKRQQEGKQQRMVYSLDINQAKIK